MHQRDLFSKWVLKEKKTSLKEKRNYLHFDRRINFNKNLSFFKRFLSNPSAISSHPFYPFIKSVINTPRFKKTDEVDNKGRKIRKLELKERPIAYAAHFDAFIYSWYSTVLTHLYEELIKELGIYDSVTAYLEKGKSNIEFAYEVFEYIKQKEECVALAFDISSFFDCLDHEHLKKSWTKTLRLEKLPEDHYKIFKSLTNYSYVEKNDLVDLFGPLYVEGEYKERICSKEDFRKFVRGAKLIKQNSFTNKIEYSKRFGKTCGIPQGSPISAALSNIYMMEFDYNVKNRIEKNGGGIYRRYCDDIIIICDTNEGEVNRKLIIDEIKKIELTINEQKTEVTYFKKIKNTLRGFSDLEKLEYKNLQYLGFEFNGENIYLRSSSISRYHRRTNARIRENLKAAYGRKSFTKKVFKKKLYNRYTIKGERNFISYAERAKDIMNSNSIYLQYKNSIQKVKKKLEIKKSEFEKKYKITN